MCGDIFWKKVLVFCLTFGSGVLVSGLFIPKELPAQNIKQTVNQMPAENKNCVPVDSNLRYEPLVAKNEAEQTTLAEKPKPDAKKKESGKKLPKEKPEKPETVSEPQLYNPSKDSAEYKKLLHREKCFEAPPQK